MSRGVSLRLDGKALTDPTTGQLDSELARRVIQASLSLIEPGTAVRVKVAAGEPSELTIRYLAEELGRAGYLTDRKRANAYVRFWGPDGATVRAWQAALDRAAGFTRRHADTLGAAAG